MANEFSTGKSIFVLTIVAGCFAVLWPNIFYPMLMGSYSTKNTLSSVEGCCDVMIDSDVNAIKIMTHLCEKILESEEDFDRRFLLSFEQGKLTEEIVNTCQKTVLSKCGIDITEFLKEKVKLGRTYKQIVDGLRSLNSSLCLKENFGVNLAEIGLPRRMRVWGENKSKHLRQERPPHLRPEMMHPALREKGRAIPQSHGLHQPTSPQPRPGPVPGLRPPMGGAGHVVPPPKGSGTMGIVMPMYTIGIVVFFLYTMMKLMFKKTDDSSTYEGFTPDPEFRRVVFDSTTSRFANNKEMPEESTKLGDLELDMLKKRLQETEKAMERIVAKMMSLPHSSPPPPKTIQAESESSTETELSTVKDKDEISEISPENEMEGKSAVKVLGMEMTESCESGAKWSHPPTPLSRPSTPQNIYLPGSLPSQSQLLVSDSHTETLSAQDNAVVLTGKVTLSLIGLSESEIQGDKCCVEEAEDASQSEKGASEETLAEQTGAHKDEDSASKNESANSDMKIDQEETLFKESTEQVEESAVDTTEADQIQDEHEEINRTTE